MNPSPDKGEHVHGIPLALRPIFNNQPLKCTVTGKNYSYEQFLREIVRRTVMQKVSRHGYFWC